MKKILSTLLAVIFTGTAIANPTIALEYVSIDCPSGDITLSLNENGSFLLEIKYWSKKLNKHTHSEKISGKWKINDNTLTLKDKVTITYKRDKSELTVADKSASIDSFFWLNSTAKIFADTFTLIERKEIDKLFTSAIPVQKP